MLIISECRTCNADKSTCPVAIGLREKLNKAGIKDLLKYKCKDWQKHLKYKAGDKVIFHFIESSSENWRGGLSGETLTGIIIEHSKKKPVYMVMIDKENRRLIDKEFTNYDKYVTPYSEEGIYISDEDAQYFLVPVKEELIVCIAE